MKKTIIALAAVAATGGAFAQWTVGGKLDIGVKGDGGTSTTVQSGAWETSRVVLKGEHDLGDGLKGSAYLEGGLGGDTATAAFSGFGRQAFVSVAGGWGKVDLGSMWTPIDTAVYYADALEYNGFSAMGTGFNSVDTGNNAQGNAQGSIQYTAPAISGFTLQLMTAPNSGDSTHQGYVGAGLNFATGNLLVNAAYQTYKTAAGAAGSSTQGIVVAGQYNFGAVTAIGGYVRNDTGAAVGTGYNIGVKVPVGGANYVAGSSSSYNNGAGLTSTGYGINYIHAMGSATVVYAGYRSVSSVNTAGAGLRFNF